MRKLTISFAALVVSAFASVAPSAELLPADRPLAAVIDHYIDAALKRESVTAARPADDATLIRRLTLDLNGRIPTIDETRSYVGSADPTKRERLVDRLMASPAFARHQAEEFDVLLMQASHGSLREYLNRAFAENRSWRQIFRELLLPDAGDPKQKGASEFLRRRVADLDQLTADVSTVFFGVNVSCARCHDHPLVADWKQDHFFGMKSFFARTFENGDFLGERDYGAVRFKTKAGKDRQAKLMFLTGAQVEAPAVKEPSGAEQKKERELLEQLKKSRRPPPAPKFSARAKLVELALKQGQQDFFARAIVNRLWHRFYGRGLVMPLDQLHSENSPSHPELLAWMARDLVTSNYDLRRLTRGLVLSQAYARSSRWEGASSEPDPTLFATARLRPLTPMQFAVALRLATGDPMGLAKLKPEDFERRIADLENQSRDLARSFEQPYDNFQISAAEALLFSNGERMQRDLLGDGGDRLIGRLKQTKTLEEKIELLVRAVFSRQPTADEMQLLGDYLKARADQPIEACRQLAWALLCSSEFRFNF